MAASETDLVLHRGHYGNGSFNVFIPQGHMEEDKLAGLSAAQLSVWQWASLMAVGQRPLSKATFADEFC